MRLLNRLVAAVLCGVLVTLISCDENDTSSVTLEIRADLSASLRVCSLQRLDAPAAFEASSNGIEWQSRAQIQCSKARIARITETSTIADITISASSNAGANSLRIRLPRGTAARWPRLLAPVGDDREKVRQVASPKPDDAKDLGKSIKLTVVLPAPPVSTGARVSADAKPSSPKIESKVDDRTCTLLIAVSEVVDGTDLDPIVWDITW